MFPRKLGSAAAVAEASPAIVTIEFTHFVPRHVHHCLDDELADSVTALDAICGSLVGVQQHNLDLPSIRAVDEPWAIDHSDSMFECKSTARQDETGISEWESKCDSRRDEGSPSGCWNHCIFTREEVEAGISRMRVHRKRKIGIESKDTDLEVVRGHGSTLVVKTHSSGTSSTPGRTHHPRVPHP